MNKTIQQISQIGLEIKCIEHKFNNDDLMFNVDEFTRYGDKNWHFWSQSNCLICDESLEVNGVIDDLDNMNILEMEVE